MQIWYSSNFILKGNFCLFFGLMPGSDYQTVLPVIMSLCQIRVTNDCCGLAERHDRLHVAPRPIIIAIFHDMRGVIRTDFQERRCRGAWCWRCLAWRSQAFSSHLVTLCGHPPSSAQQRLGSDDRNMHYTRCQTPVVLFKPLSTWGRLKLLLTLPLLDSSC